MKHSKQPKPVLSVTGMPTQKELKSNPSLQLEAAEMLARAAHQGQKRETGEDYFTAHVEPTAKTMESEYLEHFPREAAANWGRKDVRTCVIAATYLHDVVEDTGITINDLKKMGFQPMTCELVDIVTKRPGEEYFDFIMRIHNGGSHPSEPCGAFRVGAVAIKLVDLKNNLSTAGRGSRKDKYRLAEYILSYFNK